MPLGSRSGDAVTPKALQTTQGTAEGVTQGTAQDTAQDNAESGTQGTARGIPQRPSTTLAKAPHAASATGPVERTTGQQLGVLAWTRTRNGRRILSAVVMASAVGCYAFVGARRLHR